MENLKINQTGITEILLEDENGLKQGKYFKYENGRIKEEGQYKDSKKDGKWTYYVIEQNRCLLQKEENYKDGQLHGEYKEFYLYGGIKIEAQYKEGKLEGNYKSYWEHGQLKEKGQYKDGKKDGKWNEYPIDEKKIREKTYIDGEIISERVIKKNFLDSIKNMITKSISNENSEMKIKRKIIKKSKEEELEL